MAKTSQRLFALISAVLFFAATIAFSVLVVWQISQDNKQDSELSSVSETTNQEGQEGILQGTKLADFTPTENVESLQIIDLTEGTGDEVQPGATVSTHYTGAVADDGTIFQSSLDGGEPISFSLSGVIKGWQEGIPGMKVGGKRRLIIPADLAYGANPPQGSGIPPNAALVFDIELFAIE